VRFMEKIHLKEYLKGYRESWSICMQCASCYYKGPIVPHNWRELPPFEWSPPNKKCPSYEYFKFRAFSPVGRGNLASIVFDDPNFPVTDSLIKIVYTCTGCGTCSEICKAHDPWTVIWALKEYLTSRGIKLPNPLPKLFANIENCGNIFGTEKPPPVNRNIPKKGRDVLFTGCFMRFTQPNLIETIIYVLRKAGLNLAWLGDEELCCGFLPGQQGDIDKMEKQAQQNVKRLREAGASRIIVSCAHCYKALRDYYPKLIDTFPFEVVHISEIYARLIEKGKITFNKKLQKKVTYHDPCFLGRHSKLYNEPRAVIESIPAVKLEEMERRKQWAYCCGSGAKAISLCYPDFSFSISKERLLEAKEKANTVVTSCSSCVLQMRRAAAKLGVEIYVQDISEIVAEGLE